MFYEIYNGVYSIWSAHTHRYVEYCKPRVQGVMRCVVSGVVNVVVNVVVKCVYRVWSVEWSDVWSVACHGPYVFNSK